MFFGKSCLSVNTNVIPQESVRCREIVNFLPRGQITFTLNTCIAQLSLYSCSIYIIVQHSQKCNPILVILISVPPVMLSYLKHSIV